VNPSLSIIIATPIYVKEKGFQVVVVAAAAAATAATAERE